MARATASGESLYRLVVQAKAAAGGTALTVAAPLVLMAVAGVLVRLSALELARPNGLLPVLTTGEVDRLLSAAHRIHRLGDGVMVDSRTTDVTIDMARTKDGSLVVFPALPA